MESGARIVVALMAALFVALTLYRARKANFLDKRVDSVCGFQSAHPEPAEAPLFLRRLLAALGSGDAPLGRDRVQAYFSVLAVVVGLVCVLVGWKAALATAVGAVLAYISWLRWFERRRTRQFTQRLPAFLERIRRLILIGNTFQQAFVQATNTADPLIQSYMTPIVRRLQHGASFPDSIDLLANSLNTIELHMLAAYVRTNSRFGGRIAQNLQSLIAQMSNKTRLEREINAATAETRASAFILIGITVFLMVVMALLNRSYLDFFFEQRIGRIVLAGIVFWPMVGLLVMKRITSLNL